MTRVFDGPLHVHYAQAYVQDEEEQFEPDLSDAFRGQNNGICGAARPDMLWLITGLHTGSVGFTVDIFDAPPPLDESWEEIVEVSFVVLPTAAESIVLMEWAGESSYPLSLEPGTYRVRYSARGMDEGHEADTSPEDGTLIDHYNLAFWPAERAEDQIIKQTSGNAAYWHNSAQGIA
jgi:hypothetical protein